MRGKERDTDSDERQGERHRYRCEARRETHLFFIHRRALLSANQRH